MRLNAPTDISDLERRYLNQIDDRVRLIRSGAAILKQGVPAIVKERSDRRLGTDEVLNEAQYGLI